MIKGSTDHIDRIRGEREKIEKEKQKSQEIRKGNFALTFGTATAQRRTIKARRRKEHRKKDQ